MSTPRTAKPKESFEKLIAELEKRVSQLEREDVDLSSAIKIFEEASELAKRAQTRLDDAEKVVTKLIDRETKD
jgi:exodeoxyribonuclease VII small subunit